VVGGKKSEVGRFPWQVYIEMTLKNGDESLCAGTIIHERYILTAAHCFVDECGQLARKAVIHAGAYDICEEDWVSTRVVRPRQMIFHPGYNPETFDNDIAILSLKKKLIFGSRIKSVNLPPPEAVSDCKVPEFTEDYIKAAREACENYEDDYYYYDVEDDTEDVSDDEVEEDDEYYSDYDFYEDYQDDETAEEEEEEEEEVEIIHNFEYKDKCTTYYDGRWATVYGWGSTFKFDGSCILRKANKKLYPNHHRLCLDENDYVLDEDKVCGYNPNWESDTCQGDSGGGMVVHGRNNTPPELVGVVSYGEGCGDLKKPGIYARVQYFTGWIRSIITDETRLF